MYDTDPQGHQALHVTLQTTHGPAAALIGRVTNNYIVDSNHTLFTCTCTCTLNGFSAQCPPIPSPVCLARTLVGARECTYVALSHCIDVG
jgi:hypothetical protein